MENINKKELENFDKVLQRFDEFTDKYEKLTLNEIKLRCGNHHFVFLIKESCSLDMDMLERFVRKYYKHQYNLCVEILNEKCLSYTIVGFDK